MTIHGRSMALGAGAAVVVALGVFLGAASSSAENADSGDPSASVVQTEAPAASPTVEATGAPAAAVAAAGCPDGYALSADGYGCFSTTVPTEPEPEPLTEADPAWDCRWDGPGVCPAVIHGTTYLIQFVDGSPTGVTVAPGG